MGQGETGYHEWSEEDLVRETVSNFESLEGVDSVEWVTQPRHATYHELIRVRTRSGNVIRLTMSYCHDDEDTIAFDESFRAA